MLKNIVDPYVLFTDVFCVPYCEKNQAKVFPSLERVFFSKICVFNNLFGFKK